MRTPKKIHGRSTVYNRIVTPEKMSRVNPDNLELEKDYLDYMVSIDTAASSLYQYKNNLHIFWVWNMEYNKNVFFVDLKKRQVSKFQAHAIQEWGWSPKRLRTVKATLSSLSKYIYNILDDEYDDYKPIINDIKNPADVPVREKTIFTSRELQLLLDHLVEEEEYMKAALLAIAINSGRRKAELTRFKVHYFDKENLICEGALYKTPEKMVTKGRGMEGKLLDVYTLAKPVQPYIDLWIAERKRLKIRSQWLFPKYSGGKWRDKPIDTSTLDVYAEEFSKFLNKPFYWHSLRHYFSTYLSEQNIPDSIIQDMIGWESGDMVRLYVDTKKDNQFEKFFGKNGIKDIKQGLLQEL